jgi:hypothetical protein
MGRPERVLFAALLRAARRFERQGLPLTGVAGTRHALWGLAPAAALAAAFRAPPGPGASSFEEGALLLSRLEAQGAALAAAEEETRAALGEWAALARAWGAAGAGARGAGAAVAEAGLALLSAQARAAADPLGLDDDGGASDEGEGGGVAPSLDGLAAAARARHPAAFPPLKNGALFPADAPAEAQAERLQALSDVSDGLACSSIDRAAFDIGNRSFTTHPPTHPPHCSPFSRAPSACAASPSNGSTRASPPFSSPTASPPAAPRPRPRPSPPPPSVRASASRCCRSRPRRRRPALPGRARPRRPGCRPRLRSASPRSRSRPAPARGSSASTRRAKRSSSTPATAP